MIHISAEAINLRSPYKVKQDGENIFLFTTKYGVVYNVGFVPELPHCNPTIPPT